MNVTDLAAELRRQAEDGPDPTALRRDVTRRSDARLRRRRSATLLAAAAAVVLLLGGAGVVATSLRHGTVGPSGPPTVVAVPDVPLPADTTLVRHQLQPVISPVTAPAPTGMNGSGWIQTPGQLALGYGVVSSGSAATTGDASGQRSAGYVITDTRDAALAIGTAGYAPGGGPSAGPPAPDTSAPAATTAVTTLSTTVGGHPAELQLAPPGTIDGLGFPAERRLVWQLGTGRWIHVWGQSPDNPHLLEDFAASIVERPTPLLRSIGIGLTLPGLTEDSSINYSVLDESAPDIVFLCPPGTRPFAKGSGQGGSDTTGATGAGSDGVDVSVSAAPGSQPVETAPADRTSSDTPSSRCLVAYVIAARSSEIQVAGSLTTTAVGDTTVSVAVDAQAAFADLGNGSTAAVIAPATARLSAADLAAAVASVRLSPEVTVLQSTGGAAPGVGTGGVSTYLTMSSMDASSSLAPASSSLAPASSDVTTAVSGR